MRCAEAAIAAIAASLCACVPVAIAQPFGLGPGTLQGPASVSRASHVLTLRRAGGEVRLLEGGRVVDRLSPAIAGPVVLDGTPGNDTLRVDFRGGNPVPRGLIFDGGADAGGRGDGLELVGGRFARTYLTFAPARPGRGHDGTVVLDGTKIVFRDLEPLALTGTSADLVVTVPQGDGDNQTVLENDAANQASMSQLRSGAGTFETTTFTHPTNSLTFSLRNDPTESLTVNDDSIGRRITVNGGSGANVLSLGDGKTLNGGQFDGAGGIDRISYAAYTTPVVADLGANAGLTATLDPEQESPATSSSASGTAALIYDNVTKKFAVNVSVSGIAPASVTGSTSTRPPSASTGRSASTPRAGRSRRREAHAVGKRLHVQRRGPRPAAGRRGGAARRRRVHQCPHGRPSPAPAPSSTAGHSSANCPNM